MIDNKSKPIYWIIAGTWNEYEAYYRDIRSNHPERLEQYDYRYVNDPNMLRGQRDIEGSFIGTWYLRPEATQIYETIWLSHKFDSKLRKPMYEHDMSKPIYWIIAGHHQEYVDYMRNIRSNHPEKLGQYDYRYASDPNMLRGYQEIHGSFIGTWYLKSEATQIYETIWLSHKFDSKLPAKAMHKARMVLEHHGKPIGARGAD